MLLVSFKVIILIFIEVDEMIEQSSQLGMICYLKAFSNEELEAVNKYWEIDLENESRFALSVQAINSLFPDIKNPAILAYSYSEFVFTHEKYICPECGKHPRVTNRTKYTLGVKARTKICKVCTDAAIELEKKRNRDILDTYKASLFEKYYDLADLTYVEKISLFLILNSYYNEDKPLSITNENLDLSGSQDSDSKLFVDLAQKGCLVIVNDLPEDVQEAYDAIYGRYSRLHYDNGYNRSRYSETRSLAHGIYFNMPKQIEDISQVRSELYSHICASKISTAEIQQITQLVEDIRLANLYECIDWLEQEEFRIPIERSMKLDSLLKFVSKSYSLDKTYYSLWYHARETGAYIQKIGSRDFKTPKYFGKFLSDYFTKVKAKGWELKFTRSLPMDVNTSAIESLICELYFDDEFNWVSLTTAEIVSTWLKKLDVTDTLLIEDRKD
jgi:hypothetical protein